MNILVPTDFSDCANNAFHVACDLALPKKATLHLFHAADLPSDWNSLESEEKANDARHKYIAIESRTRLKALQEEAHTMGIQCRVHYSGGNFIDKIPEYLNQEKIDLIVMGSHGVSGKEEWFIGSNTQKAVRKIHLDTLVVKNEVENFSPEKVCFVSNLNKEDNIAFHNFLHFIKDYSPSEVHILTIDTSSWFSQPPIVVLDVLKDYEKLALEYGCQTHFYKDYSVQSGIRHFVAQHHIDLIGISYKTRNPIKRIFLGSNVEMLINHSEIPVYCVNK